MINIVELGNDIERLGLKVKIEFWLLTIKLENRDPSIDICIGLSYTIFVSHNWIITDAFLVEILL